MFFSHVNSEMDQMLSTEHPKRFADLALVRRTGKAHPSSPRCIPIKAARAVVSSRAGAQLCAGIVIECYGLQLRAVERTARVVQTSMYSFIYIGKAIHEIIRIGFLKDHA